MLEIKNLCKTYKSKGGVVVKALDNVSIKFPEKGMVFLLGKSGSGKSTLLNVTGGLDKPDSGEIIIKGRNSNTFSGADFDSYRNTFIGFIFQEYNILNEFNIEQNISLALQLQGRKNDKEAVDNILEQVDLKGYGKRKPNTLSGGQKQRIAIARALIKEPEIIMADEPTGALDSNTGKQVFDTLKKLSQEKLVIVVSHDRDFAEIYADRIIELADGKIISDVTKETREPEVMGDNLTKLNDNLLSIKSGKEVTEEDIKLLYEIIKNQQGEVVITSGDQTIDSIKQAMHIRLDNKSEVFENTKEINVKEYDPKDTKFIRSRLPFARALKMGASSLKTKPIRMIFTVFLTIVSLVMFGVASTLLFYDANYSVSTGLENSKNTFERIQKQYDYVYVNQTLDDDLNVVDEYTYENQADTQISDADIEKLNQNSVGHKYAGVYGNSALSISHMDTNNYYLDSSFTGLLDAGEDYLFSVGITKILGEYPKDSSEFAITKFVADALIQTENNGYKSYDDIVGKEIKCSLRTINYSQGDMTFVISGIYDCGEVPSEFSSLLTAKVKDEKTMNLLNEYKNYIDHSYHTLAFVTKSFYDDYGFGYYRYNDTSIYCDARGVEISTWPTKADSNWGFSYIPSELMPRILNSYTFYDLDGNQIEYQEPHEKQIYIPAYIYDEYKEIQIREYVDRCSDMINKRKFSDELKNYLSTGTHEEELYKLIDTVYSKSSTTIEHKKAYEDLMKFYNTYYKTYIEHIYTITKGYFVLSQMEKEDKTDEIADFYSLKEQVWNYLYCDETSDTIYSTLKQKLDSISGYEGYLKRKEAYIIAVNFINENQNSNFIHFEEKDRKYISFARQVAEEQFPSDDAVDAMITIGKKAKNLEELCDDYTDNRLYNIGFDTSNLMEILTNYALYLNTIDESIELEILGYYVSSDNYGQYIVSKNYIKTYGISSEQLIHFSFQRTTYVPDSNAKYESAITTTNYSKVQIANLLQTEGDVSYKMTNQVYVVLASIIDMISILKNAFLITGIVFAVFASLMLFNFISSSIASKTKDIGILRAVGARGSDLFKIFFSESGIVAVICFVLSIIASIIICWRMNVTMSEGLGFKLLDFGILNAGLIVLGSMVIAFVGTFIPVLIASKKAPIDSIRTL